MKNALHALITTAGLTLLLSACASLNQPRAVVSDREQANRGPASEDVVAGDELAEEDSAGLEGGDVAGGGQSEMDPLASVNPNDPQLEIVDFNGTWVEVGLKAGRQLAAQGTYTVVDVNGNNRGVIEIEKVGSEFATAKLKSGKVFYGWQLIPEASNEVAP